MECHCGPNCTCNRMSEKVKEEEKTRFAKLYKKSLDIGEYLSEEDRKFVESHITQYADLVESIKFDAISGDTGYRARTSHDQFINPESSVCEKIRMKVPNLRNREKGQFRLSDNLLYIGEMLGGVPDGLGVIVVMDEKNGNTVLYEGMVKNNTFNGEGRYYSKGNLYEEGTFVDGVISSGIRYYPNYSLYSGSFKDNKRNGRGRLVFRNGFFITCTWVADYPTGLIEASFPTASSKTTFNLDLQKNIFFFSDSIVIVYNELSYIFFYNGDVFVGEATKKGRDGYYYVYDEIPEKKTCSFTTVPQGDYNKIHGLKPVMSIIDNYKSFSML